MADPARRLTRRRFLLGLGGLAAAAAGGGSYMRFAEPHWLEVARFAVPLSREVPQRPVRIVHLSDFHASPAVSFEFIAEAVALALAQRPDVVALTGDFFTNRCPDAARFSEILRRVSATVPTLACLGNHDGGPWTRAAGGNGSIDEALELLRAANVTCLHNDARTITIRDRPLQFIGLGDLWSNMCEPATAFGRTPARGSAARILLNHNPDAKDALRTYDWDLVLCGHTHGGQLRLPFLGTPFAPVIDKRYVEGLHRWQDRWLYVTRGVGNLHGVRFNCRPQVSVLDVA
jgi:uncharacterized protein